MISFHVPAVPVAQPRQRHRVITSAVRSFAQNYTPTKDPVNAYKAAVQVAASAAYQGPPLEGPLNMTLLFVMPRSKSRMKKKSWIKAGSPREPHIGKPDRDNLMKSFQDALEGLLFRNDSQIWAGSVVKVIAGGDEQPHVEAQFHVKESVCGLDEPQNAAQREVVAKLKGEAF